LVGALGAAWFGAPFFVEAIQMVGPDKCDQHAAIGHATVVTTDADDDIIRGELNRRFKFDRQHKKALIRVLTRPEAREEDQAWQRTRVIGEAAQEIERRMTFDENHPCIYKTAEERDQAYAALNPVTVLDQYERSGLKPFNPQE
jgi:hypothetical protein